MNQQIIIELMQLLGSQSIDFTGNPIRVKLTPHSQPKMVTKVLVDNRVVLCEVDDKIAEFGTLDEMTRATIGQRIRLMLAELQKY